MKQTVMILFGGESSEHEVSIVSARNVYDAIDKDKYDVRLCYIEKTGRWMLIPEWSESPSGQGVEVYPVLGSKSFLTADGVEVAVDVLFPVLHGAHGEDGDVQGAARLMHIPCAGPSVIGAAVTMDKDVTKRLLRDMKIPVVDWVVWHKSVPMPPYEDMVARLGEVLFVKPANAGSSVGVSKVKSLADYEQALKLAIEHDDLVMIESAIDCREIEVAVLGNGAALRISVPGEIIPSEEFYSYDAKYSDTSTSQSKTPADIPQEIAEQIRKFAAAAYIATRSQGMARIDFFLDRDSHIYLNEVNSIPGFTDISMFPKLLQYDGLSYTDLVDELISLAQEAG